MSDRPKPWTDTPALTDPPDADRASFGAAYERLVGIMARLRGPDGCPWDQAQSLETLRPYLVEETYEVIEAIEEGSSAEHGEELGDLLLQVVFQSELRREAGEFDAADVAHGIADKLVRRHPHVFGDEEAEAPAQALLHWEQMKAKEKANRSAIDGVPRALPALLRAQRITSKASRVGFDWDDVGGPMAKIAEELGELTEAIDTGDVDRISHELGDLLFSVVNVARKIDISAEDALNATTSRFAERFQHVETTVRSRGETMKDTAAKELEALWEEAKRRS